MEWTWQEYKTNTGSDYSTHKNAIDYVHTYIRRSHIIPFSSVSISFFLLLCFHCLFFHGLYRPSIFVFFISFLPRHNRLYMFVKDTQCLLVNLVCIEITTTNKIISFGVLNESFSRIFQNISFFCVFIIPIFLIQPYTACMCSWCTALYIGIDHTVQCGALLITQIHSTNC